jgi:hypothetical protein
VPAPSPFERHRSATFLASSTAALTTALILSAPLVFRLRYAGGDLARVDLAAMCAIPDQLARGLGLWLSESMGMGAPLMFSPESELLYPLRWLSLLFQPDLATSVHAVLHLAIAAAGAAYLARTFGVRPLGAFAAGTGFAFSGPAIDLIDHTGYYLVSASWLAVAWPLARRAMSMRGGSAHVLLLGLALALGLLAGDPQTFALAALIASVEAVRKRKRLRRALAIGGAIAGALSIGLLLWWSTREEMALGRRAGALDLEEALRWSLTPDTWLGVVWPGVLVKLVHPGLELRQVLLRGRMIISPWDATPYLGALFFAAIAAGVASKRARLAAIVFALGLMISLGSALPLLPAIMKVVPQLAWFRYPAKYLVVTALAGMIVVAIAFEEASRRRRRLRIGIAAAAGIQLAAILLIAIESDALDALPRELTARADHPELPSLSRMLLGASTSATVPLVLALVLAFALPIRRTRAIHLLLLFDYLAALPEHVALGPPLAELKSSIASIAAKDDRVCVDLISELRIRRYEVWSSWLRAANLRLNDAVELQACDGLATPLVYSPLATRANELLSRMRKQASARALGCTLYVAPEPLEDATEPPLSVEDYTRKDEPRLYRITDPIPAAFVAVRPRLHPSEADALSAIAETRTASAALAVADDPLGRAQGIDLPSGTGVSIARFERPSLDRATIALEGEGGAVVGLRAAFYAGWRASQGGIELPVVRVAGTHVAAIARDASAPVELFYRPPGIALGIGAAIAGLALLVFSAFFVFDRRPR